MWQWTHDWLKLRSEHSALRGGRLVDLYYDDDAYAYARADSKETVIIAINRSAAEKSMTIAAAAIDDRVGLRLLPLNGETTDVKVKNGHVVLMIKPRTAVAYQIGFHLDSARP